MRGKDPDCRFLIFSAGITPACAGKRLDALLVFFRCQDHPRVCGEKKMWILIKGGTLGSPPRVRGKVPSYRLPSAQTRITPACAGKRKEVLVGFVLLRDHPRVCGEKHFLLVHDSIVVGSPPRVRGKVTASETTLDFWRITPACAGKSDFIGIFVNQDEDHPRVCGEKVVTLTILSVRPGSPPRVRGKDPHKILA